MNLENFPTNETALRMMDSITGNGFYADSYVGKWLFQVMGMEMEDARIKVVEELNLQISPTTATWGLIYHEQKYGLQSIGTLEERRKAVMKKITEILPFNPEMLRKNLSELFGISKDSIIIDEYAAPYTFRISFVENGEDNFSVRESRDYVRKIKPSHLHLEVERKSLIEFMITVGNSIRLVIRSEFYPRYNADFLKLDGTWELNGEKYLNGYNTEERLDFYPLWFLVNGNAALQRKINSEITVYTEAEEKVSAASCIELNAEIEVEKNTEVSCSFQCSCTVFAGTQSFLTVENDLWYLNGEYLLDGTKPLDAEIIEYEL